MRTRIMLLGITTLLLITSLPTLADAEHFGIGDVTRDTQIASAGTGQRAIDLLGGSRAPFNGRADHASGVLGYYYMITGGKFVNGQTVNGTSASGGVFRYILDDPSWGSYPLNVWNQDGWFAENAGVALTLKNGGTIVYDNNGIETHTTNGYYDDSQTSIAGLYMGYCMSNNLDWIYSGYFKLNDPTTIDTIVGYFDGTGFYGQFDPGHPAIGYRMNIFSSYYDNIHPMPAVDSFDGDVFSSDTNPGTFTWSDTGEARAYSGWTDGHTDPIYRLTYTLDTPITLPAGEYFFSHDAVFLLPPEVQVDDDWSILSDGVIVDVDGTDYVIGYNAFDTIQEGIDAVAQTGIVHVHDGTYNESLTIDKPCTLTAASTPILDGTGLGLVTAVSIHSSDVTLNGFTIQNFGGNGIIVGYEPGGPGDLQNVVITNNTVAHIQPGSSHGFGIYAGYQAEAFHTPPVGTPLTDFLDYSGLIISGNEVYDTAAAGVVLQSIQSPTGMMVVSNNHVHDTGQSCLWIDTARDIEVSGNRLEAGSNGLFISGYGDGYYEGIPNATFDPQNILVTHNVLSGNTSNGITVYDGWPTEMHFNFNTITGNTGLGVYNFLAGTVLDAEFNFWGDPSGPADPNGTDETDLGNCFDPLTMVNADGIGDGVTDQLVDYCPWLESALTLSLEADADCYAAGDQVTVDLILNGNTAEVMAGLFYLSYDNTMLDFVSIEPGAAPFIVEEEEDVDEVTGEISYTVAVPTNTPPQGYTGAAPIVMATITFDILAEECNLEDAVAWRTPVYPFQTRLAQLVNGLSLPLMLDDLLAMDSIALDFTPPQITCPADILVDADAGECQKTLEFIQPFDDPICTSDSQMSDCWYVDRYRPAVFENDDFNGENVLRHGVDAADFQGYGDFYTTQGRKYDLDMPVGTVLGIDLFVPGNWDTAVRSVGMWATTFDSHSNVSGYPIVSFISNDPDDPANTNPANPTPRFRWYTQDTDQNPANGYTPGYVDFFYPTAFGTWYRLEIELTNSAYIFRVMDNSGTVVASATDVMTFGSLRFGNVILQAYNFGETYDFYWDNLTVGPIKGGPVVDENCGNYVNATLTYERSDDPMLTLYDPFPVGTTTITWTATDCVGYSDSCVQTITVEDHELPVIIDCPTDITQSNDLGDCGAIVNWTEPTADDNCEIDTFTSDAAPGDFFPVGTTAVTYTATDIHGNVTTCSFDVTITDDENPSITCPADISQTADANVCQAFVSVPSPLTDDNCGVASVVNDYNGTADASDVYPVGTTTVTWTVTDLYGHTAQCSMVIEVTDDEFPVITNCPADISQFNDTGDCGAIVTWTAPTAADNCGVTSWTSTHNPGDFFAVGTTAVTYTAQDAAGNTTTCSFYVTVEDNEDPTITCPAHITLSNDAGACGANVTVPAPTTNDNCGVASVVNDHNGTADASDYYAVGTHTILWTVTDVHGNTAQCSMTITVNDTENPVISDCPGDIVVQATAGGCDAVVTWTGPTVTDNCGMQSFTSTHNPGDTFNSGTTTVTYTATDIHGNTSTCSFTVTVDAYNDLIVDVQLEGSLIDDVTRCITFTFFDCNGGSPVVFERDVLFEYATNHTGHAEFTFAYGDGIPCGDYTCVLVQDKLHTLTRKLDLGALGSEFYLDGGQYVIDCTAATGNLLLQGDLYDDTADVGVDFIDVVDIGIYIALWGTVYPDGDTLCSDGYFAHADIDGDWALDTSDRAFITNNYEVVGETGCCPIFMANTSPPMPRSSISTTELRAMGLDQVARRADLNNDGMLDARDIALFNEGVRPDDIEPASSLLDVITPQSLLIDRQQR